MEMLAALVLNGEGSRLIGRRSGNAELQAFLDNVSTYMVTLNQLYFELSFSYRDVINRRTLF